MKKTKEKIITSAIRLFNEQGVSNVRLQDIAKDAGISAGNLSYHYRLKKDLIIGIIEYMKITYQNSEHINLSFLENNDYLAIMKGYLRLQIAHRFFFRDILDILALVPDAKMFYENRIKQVVNFGTNGLFLAAGRGFLRPEPHEGHFRFITKNAWAILNSWLTEREVLGEEKVNLQHAILAVIEAHYPYLTEDKGMEWYKNMKQQLVKFVATID